MNLFLLSSLPVIHHETGYFLFTWIYMLASFSVIITYMVAGYSKKIPLNQLLLGAATFFLFFTLGSKLLAFTSGEWQQFLAQGQWPRAEKKTMLGGLTGLLAGILLYASWTRNSKRIFDIVAIVLPVGMSIQRIACLLSGCCFGIPTHLPWGIRYDQHSHVWSSQVISGQIISTDPCSLPVHPTQVYDIIAWTIIFFLSARAVRYFRASGGFPEYIRTRDEEVLQRLYEDVLYKDLIAHFGIRNIGGFKKLSLFLATNFTKIFSYNSLAKILQLHSPNTVKEYISLLQESYLFDELLKYDVSLKRQYLSMKKIYMVDNGLRNSVAFKTSDDKGRLLENLVFIELKRRKHTIFYYKTRNNREVDFLIAENPVSLIQVCYDLSDPYTLEREIKAMTEAMKELSLKESTLITYNSEQEYLKINGFTILVLPVWKWLLTTV